MLGDASQRSNRTLRKRVRRYLSRSLAERRRRCTVAEVHEHDRPRPGIDSDDGTGDLLWIGGCNRGENHHGAVDRRRCQDNSQRLLEELRGRARAEIDRVAHTRIRPAEGTKRRLGCRIEFGNARDRQPRRRRPRAPPLLRRCRRRPGGGPPARADSPAAGRNRAAPRGCRRESHLPGGTERRRRCRGWPAQPCAMRPHECPPSCDPISRPRSVWCATRPGQLERTPADCRMTRDRAGSPGSAHPAAST